MSITTKTTMTGERRSVPKSPNRTTRPDASGTSSRRGASSHPGSARRQPAASGASAQGSLERTSSKVAALQGGASNIGTLERPATQHAAENTAGSSSTKAAGTRSARGATLLDAPARFLAYTRAVAGVFDNPSTVRFEAPAAEPHARPAKPGTAGKSAAAEGESRKKRAPLARSLRKPARSGGLVRLLTWSVFLVIPLFLIFNLMTNIMVAQRQYELVDMHAQEQALTQQNEALHQELGYNQAPQDLANRASLLNMFPSSSQAALNVQTGQVEGTPTPAVSPTSGTESGGNLVPAPATRDNDPSGQKAADAQQKAKEKTDKDKEAREREEKQKQEEEKQKQEKEKASASASASAASPSASAAPKPSPSAQGR